MDAELADVLLEMARSAQDRDGIARSIATYRRVLLADAGLTDRPRILINLTLALLAWAEHTGDPPDLDEAITGRFRPDAVPAHKWLLALAQFKHPEYTGM